MNPLEDVVMLIALIATHAVMYEAGKKDREVVVEVHDRELIE